MPTQEKPHIPSRHLTDVEQSASACLDCAVVIFHQNLKEILVQINQQQQRSNSHKALNMLTVY